MDVSTKRVKSKVVICAGDLVELLIDGEASVLIACTTSKGGACLRELDGTSDYCYDSEDFTELAEKLSCDKLEHEIGDYTVYPSSMYGLELVRKV